MASINDFFGKPSADNNYAGATTVRVARLPGESVLSCFDLSRYATDTPVFFLTYRKEIDPVTAETTIVNQTGWKGVVNADNNTIADLTLAPGYTDTGNDVGDYVEAMPTSYWGNELVKGLLMSHNPDGSLRADSVDNTAIQSLAIDPTKIDWSKIRLGRSTRTSEFTSTAALSNPAEITNLAVTFTLTETRVVRATLTSPSWFNSGSTGYNRLTITNGTFGGGTTVATRNASFNLTNQELNPTTFGEVTLPAGTYTFRVYLARNANNAVLVGSGSSPSSLTVEVVG